MCLNESLLLCMRTCTEECETPFHMAFIATADLYLHTNMGLPVEKGCTLLVITANMQQVIFHLKIKRIRNIILHEEN